MPRVTVIPATINPITKLPNVGIHKRRTCGYARVSTNKDEQFTSYEAQVDYYTKYIMAKPDWEFVRVYTDEGVTGTSTKKRDGFNEMIADALDGKIDLIVTKSISRFARNTVDSLTTIRKLKDKGVEVFFEKENIWTLDSKGELLITIMSSLAQEESRSISENITWGKRKSAADGKVYFAYSTFLGYDKVGDKIVINEEQAKIVRRIYRDFMRGKTPFTIADELTADKIPTPTGKQKWCAHTIESILTNEKYMGAAILQKTYTENFLTKKIVVNNGAVPQYYVEDSHPAIIPPEEWQRVQQEFARRRSLGRKYSGNSIFATRIICGDCGAYFGAKVWNSTSEKYRRVIWQCNEKFKGDRKCTTVHITEEELKRKFVVAFNLLFDIKDEVIANCREVAQMLYDCSGIDDEKATLTKELELVSALIKALVNENATTAQDQDTYLEQYNAYCEQYNALAEKLNGLEAKRLVRQGKAEAFDSFLSTFTAVETKLLDFEDTLWALTIDKVKVMADGTLNFVFLNGMEMSA